MEATVRHRDAGDLPLREPLLGSLPRSELRVVRGAPREDVRARSGGLRYLPIAIAWIVPVVIAGHLLAIGLERGERHRATLSAILRFADIQWRRGPSFVFGGRGMRGAFVVASLVLVVFFFAEQSASPFTYYQF